VPTGMTSNVHEFDAREGGSIRISLTYTDPGLCGKMTVIITLVDADGGTDVLAVHEGLPEACRLPTTRSSAHGARETRGAR